MKKETAIKILKKNIHRELCKQWAVVAVIIIIIIIIVTILVTYIIYYNPFNLPNLNGLEKSSIKIENIVPSLFTASITVSSILLGFFSVSTYNFYNQDQRVMDICNDLIPQKKAELNSEIEKSHVLEGQDNIRTIELKNSIELMELNHDASAHLQEHSLKFMRTYFNVTITMLVMDIIAFLYSSIKYFDGFFILYVPCFIVFIYYGLAFYLRWFMSSSEHKEMY